MIRTDMEWRDAPCPRCGADAQWAYLDARKTRVEILCADCGRLDLPREEFDQAATDNPELTQREVN